MGRAILFNHPGVEPPARALRDGWCAWNTGRSHTRKFIYADARLAIPVGEDGRWMRRQASQSIGFWGEWEAPTTVTSLVGREPGLPTQLHRLVRPGKPPPRAQNTDPWVFGSQMRYAICRQESQPTLRALGDGDVIFFGSVRKGEAGLDFMLDTAFVVAERFPYAMSRRGCEIADEAAIDQFYVETSLMRGNASVEFGHRVLYNGRMLDRLTTAPFSFVPCGPFRATQITGFARPCINQLFGVHFPNPQNAMVQLPVAAAEAWRRVVGHLRAIGLWPAVTIDLPFDAGVNEDEQIAGR